MKISTPLVLAAAGFIAVGCSQATGQSTVADDNTTPIVAPDEPTEPSSDGDATDATVKTAYECEAEKGRQQGQNLPVQGAIKFNYETTGAAAKLTNLVGFVAVNYEFNLEYDAEDTSINNYTGAFAGSFENDQDYNGTTYTEHHAFKKFNANVTGRTDGGGMWGYLVVNKANGTDDIDAHYVFQSGDHMGGTIDWECEIRNQ